MKLPRLGAYVMIKRVIAHLLNSAYGMLLGSEYRVPSDMTVRERHALYRLARSVENGWIVEIGSYVGASTVALAKGLSDGSSAGRLICVDTWGNDAMSEGSRDTWRAFTENTKRFCAYITTVRGFSMDVHPEVRKRTKGIVALLFIDGDHSYEAVKADWDTYKTLLRSGATVVFHDTGWAKGVQQVIDQDVAPIAQQKYALPNMQWFVLK